MGRLFPFSSSSRTASPPPSSRIVKRARQGSEDMTAPASPIRPRAVSFDGPSGSSTAVETTTPRRRTTSRDYPRSYSGQYGLGDDLLPLEIQRHGRAPHFPTFCCLYLTLIVVVHWMVVLAVLTTDYPPATSWTVTNAIHCIATLWWLHWCKGSLEDAAGEMNALTMWEQWEAAGTMTRAVREASMVVPCILCWVACHVADYRPPILTALNTIFWVASLCPKMPFMNGVRLFGINVTAGIDDEKVGKTTGPKSKAP